MVLPVSMDTTESTDSPANQEIADHRPDQLQNSCPNPRINARAKLHQETAVPQDPKEPMDHQAMQVHRAPMVNQEITDHVDHPAHQAQPADQETKAHQVNPVNSPAPRPVLPALLVPGANPVDLEPLAKAVKLAKMVPLVLAALQEMLAPQVVLARMALPAVQANQAKTAHLAVANTAHRLVWLQVIKYRRKDQLATIIYCQNHQFNSNCGDHKQIVKNKPSLSSIYHFIILVLTLERSMSKSHVFIINLR